MNNKLLISLISVLVIALLGTTAIAAYLFGQSKGNLAMVNSSTNINNTNFSQPPTANTNGFGNSNSVSPTPPTLGTNPLADHDTWITFSDDPTSFETGTLVQEGASVPDVLVCDPTIATSACEANEILVYFVDASTLSTQGSEQLGLMRSTDGGKTWSEVEQLAISNKSYTGPAVDPSAVLLPDGQIRVYYFGPTGAVGGPGVDDGDHSIYSALSNDGVHFTQEAGVRLARPKITDPEVVKWNDQWYMLYSEGQNSGLAVSEDGLTFEDQDLIDPSFGGVPGLVVTADGLRAYGCQPGGIMTALSTDGERFTKNSDPVISTTTGGLCDPSVAAYQDQYVMVYKSAPAISSAGSTDQKLPPLNSNQ